MLPGLGGRRDFEAVGVTRSREAAKGVNCHGGFFGHGLIRIFTDAAAFSAARAFQPEICPAASRGTPARPWGSPAVLVSYAKPRRGPHRHFDLCSLFCVHWASCGRESAGVRPVCWSHAKPRRQGACHGCSFRHGCPSVFTDETQTGCCFEACHDTPHTQATNS